MTIYDRDDIRGEVSSSQQPLKPSRTPDDNCRSGTSIWSPTSKEKLPLSPVQSIMNHLICSHPNFHTYLASRQVLVGTRRANSPWKAQRCILEHVAKQRQKALSTPFLRPFLLFRRTTLVYLLPIWETWSRSRRLRRHLSLAKLVLIFSLIMLVCTSIPILGGEHPLNRICRLARPLDKDTNGISVSMITK